MGAMKKYVWALRGNIGGVDNAREYIFGRKKTLIATSRNIYEHRIDTSVFGRNYAEI